jgi:hypothetical protein
LAFYFSFLSSHFWFLIVIAQFGPMRGMGSPHVGMRVFKSGARTGETAGVIVAVDVTRVVDNKIHYDNHILIASLNGFVFTDVSNLTKIDRHYACSWLID